MRGTSSAIVGAVSLILTAAAPPESLARQWMLVERDGSAPDRSLLFVDRGSISREGDNARARAALVFEQPRDGIKGFEASYDFRCGARQQRRRDIVFTQADGAAQPSALAPAGWSAVSPDTPAASVNLIACGGPLPPDAISIAGTPMANASRFFAPPQLASAAPVSASGHRLVPRDELMCRLQHGETAAQVSAHPDPAPAACRSAAMSARSPAPTAPVRTATESYRRLLDGIIRADAQDWQTNIYEPGSMAIVDVRHDARGNLVSLKGTYFYEANRRVRTFLNSVGAENTGWSQGWVEARFAGGRLQCLQYHDRDSCIASTRDYYQQANEAERQHLEYCRITGNC
jgi:hypothetical protein